MSDSTVIRTHHAGELIAGRYGLVRTLGKGGMDSIWEARHAALDRRVAVKFMLAELTASQQARRRFEREARAAGAIESEHVVSAFDFGTTEAGEFFLVLEYLEGEDLATLLARETRLAIPRGVELVQQALRGIEAAHVRGVIHRDLKPSNLFLMRREDGSELCKVLDFGVAKLTLSQSGPSTRTGQVIGTIDYMPPEQLRGDPDIDARADVYSLGCVLYECLSGERPFHADEPHVLMYRILEGRPRPLDARVPPELASIVRRALEPDAARRYQTAAEFRSALASFLSEARASDRQGPAEGVVTRTSSPVSAASALRAGRDPRLRVRSAWVMISLFAVAGSLIARWKVPDSEAPAPAVSAAAQLAKPEPARLSATIETMRPQEAAAEPVAAVLSSPSSVPSARTIARVPIVDGAVSQRPRRLAPPVASASPISKKPADSKANAHGNFDLDSDPYQ